MRVQQRKKNVFLSFLAVIPLLFLMSCGADDNERRFAATTVNAGAPISDQVVRGGFRSYTVPVIPGFLYKISMTSVSDDADLLFFGADGTFTLLDPCAVDNTQITGTTAEDCIVAASASALYFGVDGSFLFTSSAVYTIAVEQLETTNLNLSLPLPDLAGRTGARVYALPASGGVTAGITGLSDDAELYVFDDAALTAGSVCTIDNTQFTGTTPEDCTLTAGGTVYFVVDGIFSSAQTVLFTAFGTPAPAVAAPVNEGSAGAPVAVASDTPAIGQASSGTSYYVATGLYPGTRYTVAISGLTGNANLDVYGSNSTFAAPAVCTIDNTFFAGTTPEACTLTASGAALYFTVSAAGGAAYTILVEPGP